MLHEGTLSFGTEDGTVYGLRAADGFTRWRYKADGAVKGGLALAGDKLVFGDYGGTVHAIRATTGRPVWKAKTRGGRFGLAAGNFYATAAAAYGRAYIGNTDGFVYSFSTRDGKLAWRKKTGGFVYGSPAVAQVPGGKPTVYVGSYDKRFYALDARTGRVRWSHRAEGRISGGATGPGRPRLLLDARQDDDRARRPVGEGRLAHAPRRVQPRGLQRPRALPRRHDLALRPRRPPGHGERRRPHPQLRRRGRGAQAQHRPARRPPPRRGGRAQARHRPPRRPPPAGRGPRARPPGRRPPGRRPPPQRAARERRARLLPDEGPPGLRAPRAARLLQARRAASGPSAAPAAADGPGAPAPPPPPHRQRAWDRSSGPPSHARCTAAPQPAWKRGCGAAGREPRRTGRRRDASRPGATGASRGEARKRPRHAGAKLGQAPTIPRPL